MRPLVIIALAFWAVSGPSFANENSCEKLKLEYAKVISPGIDDGRRDLFRARIIDEIGNDDFCAKNLYGNAIFSGELFEKDVSKSIAIFMDLSDRGYPPSMYNLALALIREGRTEPKSIFLLIHGIMYQYYGTPEWGVIASDARELGWDYLAMLEKAGPQPEFRAMQSRASDQNVLALASRVQARSDRVHKTAAQIGTVIQLISLGAAINSIALPSNAGTCTYISCGRTLSTGDLYNFGILH